MKEITSLSNPYIKELNELKKNSKKKSTSTFLVDGEDFIEIAYKSNCLKQLLVLEFNDKYQDIEQIKVTKEILEKLSPNITASKLIGLCKYPEYSLSDLGNKILYLDGVQDPGNVGTLIRTALAFSYSCVILSKDCASIYNDKVVSSTKGAIFAIPIYSELSLIDLQKDDYQIIVTSLKDAINYRDVELKEKFVLVLGSEGQGVKNTILNLASVICKIDMSNIDSLNVAIAGGILMNEFR